MGRLYEQIGYVQLLGIVHVILWTPLFVYLVRRALRGEMGPRFRAIIGVFAVTLAIPLTFDHIDVVRYIPAKRASIVWRPKRWSKPLLRLPRFHQAGQLDLEHSPAKPSEELGRYAVIRSPCTALIGPRRTGRRRQRGKLRKLTSPPDRGRRTCRTGPWR